MAPYTFEQLLTEEEFTQSVRLSVTTTPAKRSKIKLATLVISTLCLLLMYGLLGSSVGGYKLGWISTWCLIGLGGLAATFLELRKRKISRYYRESAFSKRLLTYVISDEGIATESQDVCSKIGWVHITGYRETPELLILRFDVQQTMTFRKSLLNAASLQIIKEKSVPF